MDRCPIAGIRSLLSPYTNKVLLAHHYVYLFPYQGCFCAVTAELSSCDRPYGSEQHLVFTPFKETDLPVSDLQAAGDGPWVGLGRESLSQ